MGTNVLGHFYLTKLLLPLLLSTAKASPEGKARVVHVSSQASVGGKLDFNAFKDGPARRNKTPWDMYYMSKLVSGVKRRDGVFSLTGINRGM